MNSLEEVNEEANTQADIQQLVRKINNAWVNDQIDQLSQYFHPDMVILASDFQQKLVGREACIQSYRDFINHATIEDFQTAEASVELHDQTAVAAYSFEITYKMDDEISQEQGREILVFVREAGRWQLLWRTVI